MKFILSKKAKLVGGIVLASIIICSGAIFGLAKTGVIHIKMLANENLTAFYVEPQYPSGDDMPVNTIVNVALPGQSGLPATATLQQSGIDGTGTKLTKNLATFSLLSNTTYNFSVVCPGSASSNVFSYNTGNSLGHNFFTPLTFIPDCNGGGGSSNGTYSLQGYILSGGQKIAGAYIALDGSNTVHATSDANGYYKLDNIPFGDYTLLSQQTFSFSAIGYDPKINQHFQGDLMINPNSITAGSTTSVNVSLNVSQARYQVTGNILDPSGHLISGSNQATIKILDKTNQAAPATVAETKTLASGTVDGKNYITPEFRRPNLNNLYIQISHPNYETIEKNLLSDNIVSSHRISGTIDLAILKDIRFEFERLSQTTSLDIMGKITENGTTAVGNIAMFVYTWGNNQNPTMTSADKFTTIHGEETNYNGVAPKNLAIPGNESIVLQIKFYVPDGYYYDKNNNGQLDQGDSTQGQDVYIDIDKSKIHLPQNAGENSYYFLDPIVLRKPSQISVVGDIYQLVDNVKKPFFGINAEINTGVQNKSAISVADYNWPTSGTPKIGNISFDNIWLGPNGASIHFSTSSALDSAKDSLYFDSDITITSAMVTTYSSQQIIRFSLLVQDKNSLVLLITENDQPVPGATVTLSDSTCPEFRPMTIKSNSLGLAVAQNSTITRYLNREIDNCTYNLELKIRKTGYYTRYSFIEYPVGRQYEIDITKINNTGQNSIKTRVVDNSNKPYLGAKVNISKTSAPDKILATKYTDAEGYVQFNNYASGQYLVTAHSDKGLSRGGSFRQFVHDGNSTEVKLFLSLVSTGVIYPTCIDNVTLQPLKDARVTLRDSTEKEVETKSTKANGGTYFIVEVATKYTLQCVYQNHSHTPLAFTTPSLYTDFDKPGFNNQFILATGTDSWPEITKIIVTVKDAKTGQPIQGAKVNYYADDSWSGAQQCQDLEFVSVTDGAGQTALMDNFSPRADAAADQKCSLTKRLFREGEKVKLRFTHSNYKEYVSYQTVYRGVNPWTTEMTVFLRLDGEDNSNGQIEIYDDSWPDSETQAENLYKRIEIYKKDQLGSWQLQKVGVDGLDTVKNESIEVDYYYGVFLPKADGIYKAIDPVRGISTEEANWHAGEWKELHFSVKDQICDASRMTLKTYSSGATWAISGVNYYNDHKDLFPDLDRALVWMQSLSMKIEPLIVAVIPLGDFNAYAEGEKYDCLGLTGAHVIVITQEYIDTYFRLNRPDILKYTLAHEYGHQVYMNGISPSFKSKWDQLYTDINKCADKNCVWQTMLDSNMELDPTNNGGHPWDNANEMFATFYKAYYLQHEQIYGKITALPNLSNCQNILAYVWQLFSENMGKVYSNDSRFFNPVGGSVSQGKYTFTQITNGSWRNQKFNNLRIDQQANVLYSRFIAPTVGGARNAIQSAINKVNALISNILSNGGASQQSGTVYGRVVTTSGAPVDKAIVQIGPRFSLTGTTGYFTMPNVPSGTDDVMKIVNGKTNTTLTPTSTSPKTVQVATGSTTTVTLIVKNN